MTVCAASDASSLPTTAEVGKGKLLKYLSRWLTQQQQPPRLAMVMCVRNEATFLAANLMFHRAIGVEKAYVFLDRCTDGSDSIAASLAWVQPIRLDPCETERFTYVSDLHSVCMDHALGRARQEGFDWLLMLDADEFAFADNPIGDGSVRGSALDRCDLTRMLTRIPKSTLMVRLQTRELIPCDLPQGSPFWNQRFFQTDRPLRRRILDPLTGHIECWSKTLGHDSGKSIVRTSARVQAFDSHGWVPFQNITYPDRPSYAAVETSQDGIHYHFIFTSAAQWRDKYRKVTHEPDRWHNGFAVPFSKQCWKKATAEMADEALDRYYARWIALPESELQQLTLHGDIIEESIVKQVLLESGAIDDNRILLPFHSTRQPIPTWNMPPSFWRPESDGVNRMSSTGGTRYTLT